MGTLTSTDEHFDPTCCLKRVTLSKISSGETPEVSMGGKNTSFGLSGIRKQAAFVTDWIGTEHLHLGPRSGDMKVWIMISKN